MFDLIDKYVSFKKKFIFSYNISTIACLSLNMLLTLRVTQLLETT